MSFIHEKNNDSHFFCLPIGSTDLHRPFMSMDTRKIHNRNKIMNLLIHEKRNKLSYWTVRHTKGLKSYYTYDLHHMYKSAFLNLAYGIYMMQ